MASLHVWSQMFKSISILLLVFIVSTECSESEEPELYYYGLEENERSLPSCSPNQACSALIQRYWRPTALVRLCRCNRRQRCDQPANRDRLIEINNRDLLQFCKPIDNWPECFTDKNAMVVSTEYEKINPDDLENLHHRDVQLVPPKITVKCKCREPNYWKLNSTQDHIKIYQCSYLPLCTTNEFCGNVNYDLHALYQSCMCPKNHICVHNGGIPHLLISEVLYEGLGWKAYCLKINGYSDEDY